MTELQSGVSLGRYELLVRIGRGGMASVWVARERSAVSGKQRLVAVKAMLPELAAHSEFRSMFLGEVQIIQAIHHDNVVRVFEVSEDRGTLYMAMEWVEGDSLRNVIRAARSRAALPPEIAVRIAADAAAGLHAAHELRDWDGELRGIVHCDVSPHNILVGIDGKAKLVDFGIANALGRLEDPQGDGENIKGKLSYMSPEQARGEKLDRRTDVFALGIVLFEMTTGEQLFKGRNANHTLELVRGGTIPYPSQLNPRYPKPLEAIVMRALDRDRERRFQTAEEFGQMLTNYLYEERILVSHSAVAQLLMRVIGPRIERRREVIARIAQAADGQLPTGEPTSQPGTTWADISSPIHSDPFNHTLTNAGDESALGISARLESQTIAAQVTSASRGGADPPSEAQSPNRVWVWLSAAVVLLLVGAAVAVKLNRSQNAAQDVAMTPTVAPIRSSPSPASSPPSPASPTRDEVDRGQNAESLPVAEDPSLGANASLARKGVVRHVAGSHDAVRPANLKLDRADQAERPPSSVGKADPSSNTQADSASASAVNKPSSSDEGINRTAANASLASAAGAAAACRSQGDTPTGQGRAAVTFAPDGSVVAVSLSQRFTGTAIGTCVAARFRQARAPAFSGEAVTLFHPFQIPE